MNLFLKVVFYSHPEIQSYQIMKPKITGLWVTDTFIQLSFRFWPAVVYVYMHCWLHLIARIAVVINFQLATEQKFLSLSSDFVNLLCLSLRTEILQKPFSYTRFFLCDDKKKNYYFLKHDAVRSGRILPSLQRILLNPSSGQYGRDNRQVKKFPTFYETRNFITLGQMHFYEIRSPLY
jgi:hypothetical protein